MEKLSHLPLRALIALARERLGAAASKLKTREELVAALSGPAPAAETPVAVEAELPAPAVVSPAFSEPLAVAPVRPSPAMNAPTAGAPVAIVAPEPARRETPREVITRDFFTRRP